MAKPHGTGIVASAAKIGAASPAAAPPAVNPDTDFSYCKTVVNCCDEHAPKNLVCQEKRHHCCFEVFMTRCRVTKQANFDGKAELMLTGYANEQQVTFPGMGLWFVHHRKWGWRTIHKKIGRYHIEEGKKLPVYLMLDAIEVDVSAAGSWEMGSNDINNTPSKTITLECGIGTTSATLAVDTHKVKNLLAGQTTCTIEVEFAAFEVACCC